MMIIRPIKKSDLEAFEKLAFASSAGITNLPKNPKLLKKKINLSLEAFQLEIDSHEVQRYVFVLEDSETGEIGGTAGIFSKIENEAPQYYYRVENLYPTSKTLPVPKKLQILNPICYKQGPTEICALYVAIDFRKEGLGRLLSLSRFLFIANFSDRFEEIIFAEMRGMVDKNEKSPFWDALGSHFLPISFAEVSTIREQGILTIPDIIPKYPIYMTLLPLDVQENIGKPHENTLPALKMLQDEGFLATGEVDIADAGPRVAAKKNEIKSIRTSQVAKINISENPLSSNRCIICNVNIDFRSCYGDIAQVDNDQILISTDVAKALNVKTGDLVRYLILPQKRLS